MLQMLSVYLDAFETALVFEELHIRVNAPAFCTRRNPLHPIGSHSVPVETFLRLGTSQPSMLPRGKRPYH